MNRHRLISSGQMDYPIGDHILSNLPSINEMSDAIYLVIAEHYDITQVDNLILVCRGSSGAMISGIVSSKLAQYFPTLHIMIEHIKKDGESSHDSRYISNELFYNCISVIIDDFIATGSTIKSIMNRIHENYPKYIFDILCVTGEIPSEFYHGFKHCICSR